MGAKTACYIWVSEEEFRDPVPKETLPVVWMYSFYDGNPNIYFGDGSETLGYKAFASKRVKY